MRAASARTIATDTIRPTRSTSGFVVAMPKALPLTAPAVVDGVVYVGGGFGSFDVYALDARSGEARWGARLSDDGPSAPAVCRGRVVVNTESCATFALDARDGRCLWARWLGDPQLAQPAIASDRVVTSYPGAGRLHRIAAFGLDDGLMIWEMPIPAEVISAPVIAGGDVYVATYDGSLHRFRLEDGWCSDSRNIGATSAPWIAGGEVFVARSPRSSRASDREESISRITGAGVESGVYSRVRSSYLSIEDKATPARTSSLRTSDTFVGWANGPPEVTRIEQVSVLVGETSVRGVWEFQGSRPVVAHGRIFTVQGSALRAIDLASGRLAWSRALPCAPMQGGHHAAPPVWVAGRVIVATVSGELLAFRDEDGARAGCWSVGAEVRFPPAIVGGRAYVATASGALHCIDLGDASLDGWPMWGGGPARNGWDQRGRREAPRAAQVG